MAGQDIHCFEPGSVQLFEVMAFKYLRIPIDFVEIRVHEISRNSLYWELVNEIAVFVS